MNKREVMKLARFVVVGACNTGIGLSVIFICLKLGAGDAPANAIGYMCALSFSYTMHRKWTFRHDGAIWPTLWRFSALVLVAYSANLAATLMMVRELGEGSFIAQLVGNVFYSSLFFLGSRLFVFKKLNA